MSNNKSGVSKKTEKRILEKKVHRALFDVRKAIYMNDEAEARRIVRNVIKDAAPLAYQASFEGGFNWVVEILKPLDDLFLPDDE
jgi:hypothetical protein